MFKKKIALMIILSSQLYILSPAMGLNIKPGEWSLKHNGKKLDSICITKEFIRFTQRPTTYRETNKQGCKMTAFGNSQNSHTFTKACNLKGRKSITTVEIFRINENKFRFKAVTRNNGSSGNIIASQEFVQSKCSSGATVL